MKSKRHLSRQNFPFSVRRFVSVLAFLVLAESFDLFAAQLPRCVTRQGSDVCRFERLVVHQRRSFIAHAVEQNSERQLRRAAACIAPFEARRRVVVQLLAGLGIEKA